MKIISFISLTVILTILGLEDIKRKSIPSNWIYALAVHASLWKILIAGESALIMLAGLIPSIMIICMKMFFPLGLGEGDIAVFAILGILTGPAECIRSMLISSVICAVFTAILLLLKRLKKGDSIAFIPFITVGTVLGYAI